MIINARGKQLHFRKDCPYACFYDAVGTTKSLHIYCWELDAVSRFFIS